MKRGFLIGGGVLIVLIVAGVFIFFSSLDSIVKAAIEKIGSQVTQVEVSVNEVEISASSGSAAIRGLKVGNPIGFETSSAFELSEVSVTIDPGTLTDDMVVIKEIVIAAPKVTYEIGMNKSNLGEIQRNVEAYVGPGGGQGADEAKDEGGKKFVIEHLYVRDSTVAVSGTMLKGKELGAGIPDIHLTDIGKDKGGANPSEITNQLIAAITDGAGKAVANLGVGDLANKAKEQAAGAVESAKGKMGGLQDKLGPEAAGAGDALKGLFGGKK